MKWTTANVKNPNYTENHQIYVGTHTGSFKRLEVYGENPHVQANLQSLQNLTKDSNVTALDYGNEEKTEILVGRANKYVKVFDVSSQECTSSIQLSDTPIVGLARYDSKLVAGFGSGNIQILSNPDAITINSGDNMSRMRQCSENRKLVATGGKGRQNNLKVFDLETTKRVFTSKNLPNDFLNLEVPVWDCDVGFLDANTLGTCSRHGYIRFYDIRTQRRPIQHYINEEMSFSCINVRAPYIYAGTTLGNLKAFDTRKLKNFVHTYKGFTGTVSDLAMDDSGKYLASSSLDRYVRVHHVDSCVLMYQSYVKSKPTRILIRDSLTNLHSSNAEEDCVLVGEVTENGSDDEYNDMFDKMPTIKDTEVDDPQETLSTKKRKVKDQKKKAKKLKA